MRWLLGLVTLVSIVLGALGFLISGTSGRRMDMLKGFVFGAIPAAIGLFVLFRLVFADKLRTSDRVAIAMACYPIAFVVLGGALSAVRGRGRKPELEVKPNPFETRTVDSPNQTRDTSSATATPNKSGR